MSTARLYAIWAAIGPLVGVIIGAWLAARWQQRRWMIDKKTEEYRGLLDSLCAARNQFVTYRAKYAPSRLTVPNPAEQANDLRALNDSVVRFGYALTDRLFVRNALKESGVLKQFDEFLRSQDSGGYDGGFQASSREGIDKAAAELNDLHRAVVEIAESDLGLK